MKTNPGGQLSPDEVVGRDVLIRQIWKILEKQSLVLYSERRIGKTSVIKKMEAQPAEGFRAIYFDLEKVGTCSEFFELLYKRIFRLYSKTDKTLAIFKKVMDYVSQSEITLDGVSFKLPKIDSKNWKASLSETFKRIDDHVNNPIVLFFDELPMMIDVIRKREGHLSAMDMLDTLRSVRQTTGHIRMVYTGSIGLHHVVNELRKNGYSNPSTNDMKKIDVPPLAEEDAVFLAEELIRGEGIETSDIHAVAKSIASDVDRIPFYIQHIIAQAALDGTQLDESNMKVILNSALNDPADVWDMKHYLERIDDYYSVDERKKVITILDIMAGSDEPLAFDDIFKRVKASIITDDRDKIIELINLIGRDHYLIKGSDGRYDFAFQIIKRWWKTYRELGL